MSAQTRLPVLFVPHGGGPCFFIDGPPPFSRQNWESMATYLRQAGAAVSPRPKAILVISGHWDANDPTVNTATDHSLFYDYYGFPDHTYQLKYPAKGSPALAARVRELLGAAGIASGEDSARGLDHGVFIPFMLMFPDADIPIVQLSLRHDMDAAKHIELGKALQPLRDEGVLIIGSGMSYHNLRYFGAPGAGDAESQTFDHWLTGAVTDPVPANRNDKLAVWEQAPQAAFCHPEAEHLLPLHVAAGAAGGDVGRLTYNGRVSGKSISAYQFG